MDRLVYTAFSAINEKAVERQAIVNEMANVSTIGFKRSFEVALRSVKIEGPGFSTRYQTSAVARDVVDLIPGALMMTGKPLDIAMQGSSVLGVQASNGELAFTRRGDLRVNNAGQLENGSGQIVRGQGGPITVPLGFSVNINEDGTVFGRDPSQSNAPPVLLGQLMLRDASQVALFKREDGLFRVEGQAPGTDFATGPEPVSLTPQALEGSSVNPMGTMVKLIEQSRSFEHQVRMVKEAKSNDESGASMMRVT